MAVSTIDQSAIPLFGSANNLIPDFNNEQFFKKFFRANSVIALPFRGSTPNNPVTNRWGFCLVYYGGDIDTFIIVGFFVDGYIRLRNHFSNGFGSWTSIN